MLVQRTRNQFPSSPSKFVSLESGHDRSNVSILQLRKASPSPGPNGTVVLPRSSEPNPYLHFHASFTLFPSLVIFVVPPLGFDNSRYSEDTAGQGSRSSKTGLQSYWIQSLTLSTSVPSNGGARLAPSIPRSSPSLYRYLPHVFG